MQLVFRLAAAGLALPLLLAASAEAQTALAKRDSVAGGTILVPETGIAQPGDAGIRAHTTIEIFQPAAVAPEAGFTINTPASLACVYKLVTVLAGCDPYAAVAVPTGGSKAMALVTAYDASTVKSDLAAFDKQFGIAAPSFAVVYAAGTKPPGNTSWALQAIADVEWMHAMAPKAKLYLVEASSDLLIDLLTAEDKASALVAAAGGGEVVNTWGSGEVAGYTEYDSHFTTAKVVYLVATGNGQAPIWPATSPNVVAVGGTAMRRNATNHHIIGETAWWYGGAGDSAYEARPAAQAGIASIVGGKRGIPDISSAAEPGTGGWAYDSDGYAGWIEVGGTDWSAATIGGIMNLAGHFEPSSAAEQRLIYANLGTANFYDVTTGVCGLGMQYSAVKGWDFCTGVGSPRGLAGL